MKLYFDAKDPPIESPAVLNENDDSSLTENELPVDSFAPEVPGAEETLDLGNTMPDFTNTDPINEACQEDHQNDNVIESNEQVYQIEIKWLGYLSEQNSWVLERDVVAPTDQVSINSLSMHDPQSNEQSPTKAHVQTKSTLSRFCCIYV